MYQARIRVHLRRLFQRLEHGRTMYQARIRVHPNVGLHAKVPLIALLALVHLGVALAALVFGGAGRGNERGIHHGASFELQAFGLQQGINRGQNLFGKLVALQQMAKAQDA